MPRFVILEHDHPELHWDFMLEIGEALRTWRLDEAPFGNVVARATPLGDHRLTYLDYEGPVGGDRGIVKQWDAGDYEMIEPANGHLNVLLRGRRFKAAATLEGDGDFCRWRFVPG